MHTSGSLRNRESAAALLKPHLGTLLQTIEDSLGDWHKLLSESPTLTGGLTGRTRANFVHDRMVIRLSAVLSEHPGLRVKRKGQLILVIVEDQMVLKLKKLDKRLRSRNVRTTQADNFFKQEMLDESVFEGTNATAGYVLDKLSAMPTNMVVVCWHNEAKLWEIDMNDDESGKGGVLVVFDGGPGNDDVGSASRTRVRDEAKPDLDGESTTGE